MDTANLARTDEKSNDAVRALADRAFARAVGAPLVSGNRVRLLKDAAENYPAWLAAIDGARAYIHFESYIIHEDDTGRLFADRLIAKAQAGVRVRVLYDWMGGFGKTSRRFWNRLRAGGVEVRCFNPPSLSSPLGWVSRDHRKSLVVDDRIAFVTGLCVGDDWTGKPDEGKDPWRDTGVEIEGPAVADVARAFAGVWAMTGDTLPTAELPISKESLPAGDIGVRVVAEVPGSMGVFRAGQFVLSLAERRLWLTDAYFAGTTAYIQGLCAAARDGVDVRLLVPGSSDIGIMTAIARASYRSLLEAGVRVFEWNGSMIHAKTAVADDAYVRIGSTNLNIASWLTNCELDVFVEDEGFAAQVAEMYEEDLRNATEIVLDLNRKVRETGGAQPRRKSRKGRRSGRGSLGRVGAGAVSIGSAVGAAITNRRALGAAEATVIGAGGVALLFVTLLAIFFPAVITYPLAVIGAWATIALLWRAYKLWSDKRATGMDEMSDATRDAAKDDRIPGMRKH